MMDRREFRLLLKRYVNGTSTLEETKWIDHWYDLLYDKELPHLVEREFEAFEKEMWQNINARLALEKPAGEPSKAIRGSLIIKIAAAAILILLPFSIWWFEHREGEPKPIAYDLVRSNQHLKEIVNKTSSDKLVTLEDGSVVSLQPSARIAFPLHFAKEKREVYLDGKAFFEVRKNRARPFYVYYDKLITQVLGTSFTISADQKKGQITVAVKTGRVAVYENNQQVKLTEEQQKMNGVIITPNQQVIYKTAKRYFVTGLVESPLPLPDTLQRHLAPHRFDFDEAPISKVLETMEAAYGVEIMVENESIYQCPFTGNLESQPLFKKIDLVCRAIGAGYEVKGTTILIRGKGCM